MAVGDDAQAAGYPLVPESGSDQARVYWGWFEINRTRDFIAQVLAKIPVGKASYRASAGISSGTAAPSGGNDGDVYFKIV